MIAPDPFQGPVSTRLVVYGSLAPGQPNHSIVSHMTGQWLPCEINGRISMVDGYPAFSWTPDGPTLHALLFVSEALPDHWSAIDAFEGEGYRRILIPVRVGGREVMANVYAGSSEP